MNGGSPKRKVAKSRLDAVFVMVVFLLFVCFLLLITLAFAKVYKATAERANNRFEGCTAVSFIMKNLQSFDKENSISVKEIDGKTVLCLYEDIEEGEYVTYIYQNDGMLCELFADINFPFIADNGEVMLPCDSFDVKINSGMVEFSLTSGKATVCQRYFLRSNAERTV